MHRKLFRVIDFKKFAFYSALIAKNIINSCCVLSVIEIANLFRVRVMDLFICGGVHLNHLNPPCVRH